MRLRVAMSGRWSYAALNPDPGKQRGRGQELVCKTAVALSDHVEVFSPPATPALSRPLLSQPCSGGNV